MSEKKIFTFLAKSTNIGYCYDKCLSADNPKELHSLDSHKVTVWCAISTKIIFGPYFLEDNGGNTGTVNSDQYDNIINTLLLHFRRSWKLI